MNTQTKLSNSEINKILMEYAAEDLEVLKSSGYMAITGTTIGVIGCEYDGKKITCRNQMGELLTGDHFTEADFCNWIIKYYDVQQ